MSGQSWVVHMLGLLVSWLRQRISTLAARITSVRGGKGDAASSASLAQSAALTPSRSDQASESTGTSRSGETTLAAKHFPSDAAATEEEAVDTVEGVVAEQVEGIDLSDSMPSESETTGGVSEAPAQEDEQAIDHDQAPSGRADEEVMVGEATAMWPVGESPSFTPDASLDLVEGIEFSFEPEPNAEDAAGASRGWVQGDGTRECPEKFPIKGNGTSHIYHLPGQASYAATIATLCFATEQDAIENGFRPSKRNRPSA